MNDIDSELLYIRAQLVVLPDGVLESSIGGCILIEIRNGKFVSITRIESLELYKQTKKMEGSLLEADIVTPGFIDIHTHGIGGHKELLEYWRNADYTCAKVVKWGTTSIIASVAFPKLDPNGIVDSVISSLRGRIGRVLSNSAVVEGIHAEGPIVADLGGLCEGEFTMDIEKFSKFLDKMGSDLKVMTISPSVDAETFYSRMKMLIARGVVVSLGHDKKATEEQILGALRLGTEKNPMHMTHIFNVQSFHHREMGLANFGILSRFPKLPQYEGIVEPTIEFVGDMIHIHPLVVKLLLNSKDHMKMACVTDSLMEPITEETVTFAGRQLEVQTGPNGDSPRVVLKGTSTIAGSCTTQLTMFHSLMEIFDVPLFEAVSMLSHNPAKILKLSHVGGIKVGNRADLLLFSRTNFRLQKTIVAGKVAYDSSL